jgi:L-seryl-tRNA(Ser) seleniumtransferase
MRDKGRDLKNPTLRKLPSIEKLLESFQLKEYIENFSRQTVTNVAREVVGSFRQKILRSKVEIAEQKIIEEIQKILNQKKSLPLRSVINGTGVILHTNLGRAPLSSDTLEHMKEIGESYCNLEFDLVSGKRGERTSYLEKLICDLTNSEGALVVNNNAAAVLLVLTGLGQGKEVLVSRGELIQIGGGFKIPEIMAQSNAILKEVGTTNKTSLSDYQKAITKNTSLILKVHKSNFRMDGFVGEAGLEELVALGKKHKVLVFYDLGSGALLSSEDFGLAHEPTPTEGLKAKTDLVSFSGDKLLGGPQSGIILGKRKYIDLLRRHPLYRALRVDKLVIAGLEKVILAYLKNEGTKKFSVWQMINTKIEDLRKRAEKIENRLKEDNMKIFIKESKSTIGGGSLPGETLPTIAISFDTEISPQIQAEKFRNLPVPVIGRIENNKFVLDLRTIFPHQDEILIQSIKNIFSS